MFNIFTILLFVLFWVSFFHVLPLPLIFFYFLLNLDVANLNVSYFGQKSFFFLLPLSFGSTFFFSPFFFVYTTKNSLRNKRFSVNICNIASQMKGECDFIQYIFFTKNNNKFSFNYEANVCVIQERYLSTRV